MVPPGAPNPVGGAQNGSASLLRANSGLSSGQNGQMSSQPGFPSLISPRTQFNSMNMLNNVPNMSPLHQSFQNGAPSNSQRGLADNASDSDPMGNGLGYTSPSSPFVQSNVGSPNLLILGQSQQFHNTSLQDQQQNNQQFAVPNSNQFQSVRGGVSGVGIAKIEPQLTNDQQGLRNLGQVKTENQQIQGMRNLPPVKMEPQHNDQSLFLHQQQHQQQQHQQQQQQILHMSRQSPQAAAAQINLLQQQRLYQQLQQQQLIKGITQQRSTLQQPQFQPQSLPLRPSAKATYEPGMCARKLTHYMYQQQHRPEDNNIEFWRKFVAEYFTPNAKKKWCVSMYGSGRQTTGVIPQDVWHCEICNQKPGRGFEATADVLPRLFKMKYDSGTQEELLYVDMPREYQNSSGQIVLDYAKAIQESVFEQLRVVREGQLRIVFSPDLKICSWEFCARRHEELIPRRLLVPQIGQLSTAAQKYQAASQNGSSNISAPELQNNCNMFTATARQLTKAMEVPLVNDLGYTKRYVRCLQISEVVNSMKDLIDYGEETGAGPMESLTKFPRRTSNPSRFNVQSQQPDENQLQTHPQNSNPVNSAQAATIQLASTNGISSVNNTSLLSPPNTTSSTSTLAGLLHQNSMNSQHQNPSPFASGVHVPSPSPASTPQPQPTPSSSNIPPQAAGAHTSLSNSPNISGDPDLHDSQSSVQKIINEMMMSSSQLSNVPNGVANANMGPVGPGFGSMGNGLGSSTMVNGIRAAMGNTSGRVAMMGRDQNPSHQQQQHDLGNGFSNHGNNGFNNLQFDWKTSP